MLIAIILGQIASNVTPYFLKLITNVAIDSGAAAKWEDFISVLVAFGIFLLAQEILFRSAHWIETSMVVKSYDRITTYLFQTLLSRPAAYFEDRFSGEITRRVEQVGNAVKFFIGDITWEIAWPTMSALVTVFLLLNAHVWLMIVFCIWFVVFGILSFILLRWEYRQTQKVSQKQADLSGTLVDIFGNISIVQAFAAHQYEHTHYRRFMDDAVNAETLERKITFYNKMHQGSSIIILTMALTVAAVILFTKGEIAVGDFVLVAATITNFSGVVWSMGGIIFQAIRQYGEVKNALGSLENDALLVEDGPGALSLDTANIDFNGVSFSYPKSDKGVLHDFTLHIKPGEKVGLVGKSGAGKSTVVKLLLRSYDVKSGRISIGSQDTSSVTLYSLRTNIAFVPQDTALFHRTLYENILYAKPEATKAEVLAASTRAHAHDFIEQYPNGYDTLVGERGVKLSGGQRQRIALARAILKNSPVLILDEATSALDSESEEIIQQGLQELFKDRTVLAIAHRLSTLRSMDRIIVLEEGRIVEDGSPQELLEKSNSLFKHMWEHQKKGFI